MTYTGVFELAPVEWAGWTLQLGLIAWLVWRRPITSPLGGLSLPTCALILAAGWIWRLAYAFTLAADDFDYWIGDDPMRFFRAWQWSRVPVLAFPRDPWIAGSYYLHGSAMWLLGGDAIHASRFVSAGYGLLPLLGVFLFTQALFGRREISALAAILVTPCWIQVLLETGLMTELPVTGLLLSGSACLLWGLRAPSGPRRSGLHAGGALLLAAATALHLVAWIYLVVLQAGLLLARLAGRERARPTEWAITSAGSAAFCVFWLVVQWQLSGNPLAQLAYAGADDTPYKLAGTPLQNAAIYLVSLGYSLRYLLPLVAFGVLAAFRRDTPPRARWVLVGLGAALLVMLASAVQGGTNVTPFRSIAPLATALAVYAAAALFPPRPGPGEARLWPRPALAVATLVAVLAFVDGHLRIFEHRIVGSTIWSGQEPKAVPGSVFALGRWLRRELPRRAAETGELLPVRISAYGIGRSLIAHASGEPGWLESVPRAQLLDGLRAGQLVVSGRALPQLAGQRVAVIGSFQIYEAPPDAPGRSPR